MSLLSILVKIDIYPLQIMTLHHFTLESDDSVRFAILMLFASEPVYEWHMCFRGSGNHALSVQ